MTTIGVEKGKVRIEDYNPQWQAQFLQEQKYLSRVLSIPQDNILHIGSTSISNCKSKPIIDIAIAFDKLTDSSKHQVIISKTEYGLHNVYYMNDRICYTKGSPQTHHLYFVLKDSVTFLNWIIFKKVLNENPIFVNEYNELKIKLVEQYSNNRITYTEQKSDFIFSILNPQQEWKEKILSMRS